MCKQYHLNVLSTISVIQVIIGYAHTQTLCPVGLRSCNQEPQCPTDYTFENGACMPNKAGYNICPDGLSLVNYQCVTYQQSNEQMYTNKVLPPLYTSPFNPPIIVPIIAIELPIQPSSPAFELKMCPIGWIHISGECRKVYCEPGLILSNGECIRIGCQNGTVWTGNQCVKLTEVGNTIEITQHIYNFINQSKTNNTKIGNDTNSSEETIGKHPNQKNETNCCLMRTPRMCKYFEPKWVCYNRRHWVCGTICTHKMIYLKPSKVAQHSKIMILPPNLTMQACVSKNCNKDVYECSGCPENMPERCSPYCYRYICPQNSCSFVDQQFYCENYSHLPGCTLADGCIGIWCQDSYSNSLNPNVDDSNSC